MINLKLDYSKVKSFISDKEINDFQKNIDNNHKALLNKTGKGNEFLGWW